MSVTFLLNCMFEDKKPHDFKNIFCQKADLVGFYTNKNISFYIPVSGLLSINNETCILKTRKVLIFNL